jgi:hypothetical protein
VEVKGDKRNFELKGGSDRRQEKLWKVRVEVKGDERKFGTKGWK